MVHFVCTNCGHYNTTDKESCDNCNAKTVYPICYSKYNYRCSNCKGEFNFFFNGQPNIYNIKSKCPFCGKIMKGLK